MAFRSRADIEASSKANDAWPAIKELLRAANVPARGHDRWLIDDYTLEQLKPLYKKLKEAVEWRTNSDTYSSFSTLENKVIEEVRANPEYDEMGLLDLDDEVHARVFRLKKELAKKKKRQEQSGTTAGPLPACVSIVDAVFAAHEARTRTRR